MNNLLLFKRVQGSVLIKDTNGTWKPALALLKWGCMFVYFRDGSNKQQLHYLLGLGLDRVHFSPPVLEIEIEETSVLKLASLNEFTAWRNALGQYCKKRELSSKFLKRSRLGRGGFGEIYLAQDIRTRKNVAVKLIKTENMRNHNELEIMSRNNHPCVMEAFDIVLTESTVLIFMPFMNQGSIRDIIKNHGRIPENVARTIMRRILLGVEYLHKHRIVHRDIKPHNITVDYDKSRCGLGLIVKICDFGLSEVLETNEMIAGYRSAGTRGYKAPEMLLHEDYGMPLDVWACGVVMFEMMACRKLFYELTRSQHRNAVLRGFIPDEFSVLSIEAKKIIARLMNPDQYSRISISTALKDPWFSNYADCSKIELNAFFSS